MCKNVCWIFNLVDDKPSARRKNVKCLLGFGCMKNAFLLLIDKWTNTFSVGQFSCQMILVLSIKHNKKQKYPTSVAEDFCLLKV